MKAQSTTSQALDDVQSGTSESIHKIRQELDLETPPPPKTKPVQTRYCYHTFEDVVCYNKPIPGQEDRLTGYQNNKSVGYVIDPPPEPKPKKKPASVPATTAPAPGANPATPPADGSTSSDTRNLKEITFDPAELQPKKLVPDRVQ